VTPYYQDDWATIYHGDVRDVLPHLRNIDLFFTSPPYNLGTSSGGGMHKGSSGARGLAGGYESYADNMPQQEYDEWQTATVSSMWSALSDNGAIFYNHKPRVQDGVAKLPTDYGAGLPLRQVITWDKGGGINFSRSFFLPTSEWIVIWAKEGWKLKSKDDCLLGDIWRVRADSGEHPAPFPLSLPSKAIKSSFATVVADPFMGSGTTLRAAKNLNRRSIGIEIEEKYCEIAANRLSQEVMDFTSEEK
jgi:site-specific DNA-methyltransferase (adenine-specific)